jgi:hypothetical protein
LIRRGQAAIAFSGIAITLVFSAEESAADRAPRADADAKLLRGGNVLALEGALDQRVFVLQSGDALLAFLFGDGLRARDVPSGAIRQTVVADLPFADQVGERRDDFFDRRDDIRRSEASSAR